MPLMYLFFITSFRSSANSAPSFGGTEGADAMGLLEGGLCSSKASCRVGTGAGMLLDFGGNGFGSPGLGVSPVIVDGGEWETLGVWGLHREVTDA